MKIARVRRWTSVRCPYLWVGPAPEYTLRCPLVVARNVQSVPISLGNGTQVVSVLLGRAPMRVSRRSTMRASVVGGWAFVLALVARHMASAPECNSEVDEIIDKCQEREPCWNVP